jgi:hypothetical protein
MPSPKAPSYLPGTTRKRGRGAAPGHPKVERPGKKRTLNKAETKSLTPAGFKTAKKQGLKTSLRK